MLTAQLIQTFLRGKLLLMILTCHLTTNQIAAAQIIQKINAQEHWQERALGLNKEGEKHKRITGIWENKKNKNECQLVFTLKKDSISATFIRENHKINYTIPAISAFKKLALLNDITDNFRKQELKEATLRYHEVSNELFITFLGPVSNELTKTISIISPVDLKNIPWNSLVKKNGNNPYYMIYDHEIILNEQKEKITKNASQPVHKYIVAPEFNGELGLKYQDKRLQKSNHQFIQEEISNRKELTPSRELCQDEKSILHLATHNFWNKEQNDFQLIISNKEEPIGTRNIRALNLQYDLVFINACESARIRNGVSINTAFLEAASQATIGTLWKIEDYAASKIAESFYMELLKGHNKSSALRNAQLKYIRATKSKHEQHPYFWGAYLLEGNNTPLFNKLEWTLKRVFSVVVPILTSISMFFFYFGKNIKRKLLFMHFL